MAASVGKLSAVLALDSQEFVRGIRASTSELNAFAEKATRPLRSVGESWSAMTRGITGPLNTARSSLQSFTSGLAAVVGMLPGGGAASSAILQPIETARRQLENLDALGKQARRAGLDPQVFKGLSIAAEDEAGAIEQVMAKLLRFQGQIKVRGQELLQPGGSKAETIAAKWALDVERLRSASPQELLLMVSERVAALNDPAQQAALAFDVLGKSAGAFMNTIRDPEGIREWVSAVQSLGYAGPDQMAVAKAFDDLHKLITLRREAFGGQMIPTTGLIGMGMDQVAAGDVTGGAMNISMGMGNWVSRMFGGEAVMPKEISEKALREAQALMGKAGWTGDNPDARRWGEISRRFGEDQASVWGRGGITESEFAELAAMTARAREAAGINDRGRSIAEQIEAEKRKWEELAGAIGKTKEQLEVEQAIAQFGQERAKPLIDQITAYQTLKDEAEEYAQAMREVDAEAARMTAHAEARRARSAAANRHPFAAVLESLSPGEMMRNFAALESQYGLGGAPRLAGAATAGSREAYSIDVASARGTGDVVSRVEAVKEAIERHRAEAEAFRVQAVPLLEAIARAQPGIAD